MGAAMCKCDGSVATKDYETVIACDKKVTLTTAPSTWSLMEHLTEERVTECREAFERFAKHRGNTGDTEGITAKELSMVIMSFGQHLRDGELELILLDAGVCGQDTIDFPMFLGIMAPLLAEADNAPYAPLADHNTLFLDPDMKDIIAYFEAFDRSRTGFISKSQLPHVMATLGNWSEDCQIEHEFAGEFGNNDKINYRELLTAFHSG
jgi:Ca2+-binding EF-hand superfamily protein